jgi:hypothetical protein
MSAAGDRDGEPAAPRVQDGGAHFGQRLRASLKGRNRGIQAGVHVIQRRLRRPVAGNSAFPYASHAVRYLLHQLAPVRLRATLGARG